MATKHAKPGSTAAPARAQRPPVRTLYDREFWSIGRHELIAAAAEELLSPDAKTEVKKLLKPIGVAFPDIAGWADEVKRRKPRRGDDPDTVDFLEDERNAHADTWHYVDLPVGAHEYSRRTYPEFTRPDDVVQMLAESIKVLQGASDRFSVLNALRLTVHLVGDVHQPLHVGCGYLDRSTEVPRLTRDPAIASRKKLESDHGGNYLILPIGSKGPNLHAYWDGRLGGSAPMHAPVAGPAFLTAAPPPALIERSAARWSPDCWRARSSASPLSPLPPRSSRH
jgi:S1/P1 Nuclease.